MFDPGLGGGPLAFGHYEISPIPLPAPLVLMLAAILAFIVMAWRKDRVAAWLFVPYAAWVSFASVLNAAIWMLN